jgi:heptosyltransferase-2
MAGPRILVIRCGAVGDTVLATCVLDPILARWPDARIEWLATPGAAALFGADPRIAQLHRLRHRKLPIWLSPVKLALVRSSRRDPFALVLNLECAAYMHRFVHALRAERVVGYGDGADWQDRHGVENHRAVLAAAGLAAEGALPRLVPAPVPAGLPPRFVVLHPGNSHSGGSRVNIRAWPIERWVELNRRLHAAGVATVITGAPSEAALTAQVAAAGGLDLGGRTDLPAMAGVMARAALLVCTDTGPVHIAAAVGSAVLGLYGPTRPTQTAPFGAPGQVRLLSHAIDCGPCYGTPRHKTCTDNRCMQLITVDEVFDAVLAGWQEKENIQRKDAKNAKDAK